MKQLFVETELGTFPVTQLHWSPYFGHLQRVVAETPYERGEDAAIFHFRIGEPNIVEPDNTIDLVSVDNPDFRAKLIL